MALTRLESGLCVANLHVSTKPSSAERELLDAARQATAFAGSAPADLRRRLQRPAQGERGLRPARGALRPRSPHRPGPAQPPARARTGGDRASRRLAAGGSRRGRSRHGPEDPSLRPQPRDWEVRNCGIVRTMARTSDDGDQKESSRAEQSVQAFRDALEKSITISRDRLQEVVDDAVRRGRMTRGDAEEMVGRLATRGPRAGRGPARPARARALAGPRGARTERAGGVEGRAKQARKRTVAAVDKPLAGADRVRRAARVPGLPDHRVRPALRPADRPPAPGAQPNRSSVRSATTSARTRPARACSARSIASVRNS